MTRLVLREREKRILSLSPSQQSALSRLSVVSLTVKPDGIQVEAKGVVGHFDLGSGDVLVIEPKATSAETALSMLSVLRRLGGLAVVPRGMASTDDLVALLVRAFLSATRRTWRHGLQRGYQRKVSELVAVRGRLQPIPTVMPGPMSRGRVVCIHHPRTLDIPENGVLRWVTNHLGRQAASLPNLARDARALDARLGQVPLRRWSAGDALSGRRTGNFRAYADALGLAHLLLANWSWTLTEGPQGGFSWAVNMDTLFQDWLAFALSRALASSGVQIDDDKEMSLATWSSQKVIVRPDLVLRHRGTPIAVLDAKHIVLRGKPDAKLIQQVLTYGARLGLESAWLVYPTSRNNVETMRCWSVERRNKAPFQVHTAPVRLWDGLTSATQDVSKLADILTQQTGIDHAILHSGNS